MKRKKVSKSVAARCVALLLTLIMLLAAAACGESDGGSSSEAGSTPSDAELSSEAASGDETEVSDTVSEDVQSQDEQTASQGGGNATTSTSKTGTASAARTSSMASDVTKNKYDEIGLEMKQFNITKKKLKLFTGPERTMADYLSTTEVPGVWELLKAYYDIDLELVSCGDYNDWYTKLAMLSLSGDSPDVATPLSESYPFDIVKGNIRCLDDYFDFSDHIFDSTRDILDQYTWNDKHYHAVFDDGQYASPLFYNPKIFKQNGVKTPRECLEDGTWTWQTMLDMAIELTQDTNGDGTTDIWGVGGLFFLAMQESTGKSLVTVKGTNVTCNITDPVFAKVAQFIYDLGPNGKYKVATAFSHDNADLFVAGKVAMDVGSHWRAWVTYKDMWKAGTVDIVPFPMMEEGGSYYKSGVPGNYVIYKNAQNLEGAKALIWTAMYIRTPEAKAKLKAYGEKKKVDQRYGAWLLTEIPGLTTEQYNHILESLWDENGGNLKMKNNSNTWIGWLNNGWDNGFQYAHTKQWSALVNAYKNQFNSSIEEMVETLEMLTK